RSAPRARSRGRATCGTSRRTRPRRGRPCRSSDRGSLPWERPSAVRPYLDRAALRPRHGAADEQQVAVGYHVDDLEALLSDALVAHLARAADALEHARGRGRGADRTRRAHVVRAVGDGAAAEVVALDRALEALALGGAGDLDRLALL